MAEIGMKELADFMWKNLTREGKLKLFEMSTDLSNKPLFSMEKLYD